VIRTILSFITKYLTSFASRGLTPDPTIVLSH
jgi:hypothetical protein